LMAAMRECLRLTNEGYRDPEASEERETRNL
jgi:hypothetical protein